LTDRKKQVGGKCDGRSCSMNMNNPKMQASHALIVMNEEISGVFF